MLVAKKKKKEIVNFFPVTAMGKYKPLAVNWPKF